MAKMSDSLKRKAWSTFLKVKKRLKTNINSAEIIVASKVNRNSKSIRVSSKTANSNSKNAEPIISARKPKAKILRMCFLYHLPLSAIFSPHRLISKTALSIIKLPGIIISHIVGSRVNIHAGNKTL